MSDERWALLGDIVTPFRRIPRGVVAGIGARIDFVSPLADAGSLEGWDVLDFSGCTIAPGFVDIHVHGGGGADFMDGSLADFERVCKFHARGGTTALVPTTVATSVETIGKTLALVERAMAVRGAGAEVLGAHIEGPWFAASRKGAHARVWDPRPDELAAFIEWAHVIRRFTLAPELPGALAAVSALRQSGILVCAGHTDATYAEVTAAVEAGLSHVTHLWNQCSIVSQRGPYRRGGCVEAALLEDAITVEVIADGHHLPPELLRLAYKCKGFDRLCVVTDAMRGAGEADGTTWTVGPRTSSVVGVIRDGVAVLPDNTAFASSVATMDRLVRNAVALMGLPITDAVRLASLTPARIIGVAGRKGSLAAGKDADMVVLDSKLEVVATVIGGQVAYRREDRLR